MRSFLYICYDVMDYGLFYASCVTKLLRFGIISILASPMR